MTTKSKSTLESLYSEYLTSSGVCDLPKSAAADQIYFATKDRRPNSPVHLMIWNCWRWLELNAPWVRSLIAKFGRLTRWKVDLEVAMERTYDGNAYVKEVLDKGVKLAVIDNPRRQIQGKTLLVEDSVETLYDLARHHRSTIDFPIVGVTGTVGKTTTTNLIQAVLSTELKTYGNNQRNSPQAVARKILNMPLDSQAAVLEMATVREGILASSCEIGRPTHGVITEVGLAHLDTFGDAETIKRSKWELFDFIHRSGGTAFLNNNHPWLAAQAGRLDNIVHYGSGEGVDVRGELLSADPFLKVRWFPADTKAHIDIQTQLAGQHNLNNVLAAIAVGSTLGISAESIKESLEAFSFRQNRSDIYQWGTNTIYNETFSTTPTSTLANLRSFMRFSSPQKILVLGPISRTPVDHPCYQEIIDLIKTMNLDHLFLIGERYHRFKPELDANYVDGSGQIADWFAQNQVENTMIMLKAFEGYNLKEIFQD